MELKPDDNHKIISIQSNIDNNTNPVHIKHMSKTKYKANLKTLHLNLFICFVDTNSLKPGYHLRGSTSMLPGSFIFSAALIFTHSITTTPHIILPNQQTYNPFSLGRSFLHVSLFQSSSCLSSLILK